MRTGGCRLCPRLTEFRDATKTAYPNYYCEPVPAFGAHDARVVIVGLAPGLHGANATGRPFTGDFAGILLYRTLYHFGLASHPVSVESGDDLRLIGCRITNAVKCVPPANKPTAAEIKTCAPYLEAELAQQPADGVIIALGRIAHQAVVRALHQPLRQFPFAHGACHVLAGRRLWDSYHCSRYNTQTRRLTEAAFMAVFAAALA